MVRQRSEPAVRPDPRSGRVSYGLAAPGAGSESRRDAPSPVRPIGPAFKLESAEEQPRWLEQLSKEAESTEEVLKNLADQPTGQLICPSDDEAEDVLRAMEESPPVLSGFFLVVRGTPRQSSHDSRKLYLRSARISRSVRLSARLGPISK